jgi:hypothetical protein
MSERYFIDTDSDSHRYLVPLKHRSEWLEWRDLPADDPRSWDEPKFAERIDGYQYSFENPEVMA